MTNASELLEGLFREAHEADECNQMMDCDPRTIICAQTELRHFEAQVTQLEAQLAEVREGLRALLSACGRTPAVHDGCGTQIVCAPSVEALRAAHALLTPSKEPK